MTLFKPEIAAPACKRKDPPNKENYHPVSVLSHVSKIFEKMFMNK